MPLKLHVNVCRKLGLPGYGSAGASCGLEIDLDDAAGADPEALRARYRKAFALCREAVEEELARAAPAPAAGDRNGRGRRDDPGAGGTPRTGPALAPLDPPRPADSHPRRQEKRRHEWRSAQPPPGEAKPFEGTPKTGRALYLWARQDPALVKYLQGWARAQGWGYRFDGWQGGQVAEALAEARRWLDAPAVTER